MRTSADRFSYLIFVYLLSGLCDILCLHVVIEYIRFMRKGAIMRLTVPGKELKNAITWGVKGLGEMISGSDRGNSIAVLATQGNDLTITTYDGVKFFRGKVSGSGLSEEESFDVKVMGDSLKNIGDALDNGTNVTIEINTGEATFSTHDAEYSLDLTQHRMAALPSVPPRIGSINMSEFSAPVRKNASTTLHVDNAGSTPALTAVLFEFHPHDDSPFIRLVSSNRQVMLVRDIPFAPIGDFALPEESTTISSKLLSSYVTTLFMGNSIEGDVDIHVSENAIGISNNDFTGFIATLNGPNIPYANVAFPSVPNTKSIVLDRKVLESAISKLGLATKGRAEERDRINLLFKSDQIVLSTSNERSKVIVSAEGNHDVIDDESIAFDPQYLMPLVKSSNSEMVELTYSTPMKPLFCYELAVDGSTRDASYVSLAMPRR